MGQGFLIHITSLLSSLLYLICGYTSLPCSQFITKKSIGAQLMDLRTGLLCTTAQILFLSVNTYSLIEFVIAADM